MRPSSLAFALACAVALPSGAALVGFGASVCLPLIGVGLGLGLALMAALDWRDYLDGRAADLDDLKARTYAVYLSNLEREQRIAASEKAEPAPAVDQWRVMAHRYLDHANQHGFAIRTLVGLGVVTWEDWGRMVDCLTAAGVMVTRPKAGWAPGWNWARWKAERQTIALPHPEGVAPEVHLSAQQTAHNGHNTAPEGVAD